MTAPRLACALAYPILTGADLTGVLQSPRTMTRPDTTHPPKLYRISDVATQCAVSVRQVHRWIASGRLETVRLGTRCIRVPQASVQALIAAAPGGGGA